MQVRNQEWPVWKVALMGAAVGMAWVLYERGAQLGDSLEATTDAIAEAIGFGLGAGVFAAIIAVARNYATRRP